MSAHELWAASLARLHAGTPSILCIFLLLYCSGNGSGGDNTWDQARSNPTAKLEAQTKPHAAARNSLI